MTLHECLLFLPQRLKPRDYVCTAAAPTVYRSPTTASSAYFKERPPAYLLTPALQTESALVEDL